MTQWALGGSLSLAIVVAIVAATVGLWLYRRELTNVPEQRWTWVLPTLRVLAIAMIAFTLAQPQLESLWQAEKPGRVAFLLDGSQSMSLTDQPQDAGASSTRLDRAIAAAQDTRGPWQSIFAEAATTVFQSADDGGVELLRDMTPITLATGKAAGSDDRRETDSETTWRPSSFSTETPLGDQLLQVAKNLRSSSSTTAEESAAIVLLSDGNNNTGIPLSDASKKLAELGIAVYPVGFGPAAQPSDLALQSIVSPQSVFRSARVAGTIVFTDFVPPGNAAQIEVRCGEQLLWNQEIQCLGVGQRSVEFSFPAERLLEGVDVASATIHTASMTASIRLQNTSQPVEVTLKNNQHSSLVNVLSDTSGVLLVDQHSRWETRYLKNLFERDPTWDCDVRIIGNEEPQPIFVSQNTLDEVDLVIFGDVQHEPMTEAQQDLLVEFVSSGGGLIVIDGAEGHLHAPEYASLSVAMPVDWSGVGETSGASARLNASIELEPAGLAMPALNLGGATRDVSELSLEAVNAEVWQSLPELEFVANSRAKLESEVLASVASSVDSRPLFVTRRFGAGRVLYVASDQTWRWRYKQGDAIHGRLWNQLARWVARKQSRVKNDYISLDSSLAFAEVGTPIELVCQLLTGDGGGALDDVIAEVTDESGSVLRRIRMIRSEAKQFRATVADLPAGKLNVRIQAEGLTSDALDVALPLLITDKPSDEMQIVTCDQMALRELAEATGGEYLPEIDLQQLPERLVAFRGSRVQSQIFGLWSSYYWFAAAMLLLSIEWLLRKRFGLI